ncbi:MAG: TetR/AcrR family transcriptional regulator [Lachnospiraceae bacterium]|nr:TetR/AcrR family transcriptional regulator [Lachnospiraceae bacterium]
MDDLKNVKRVGNPELRRTQLLDVADRLFTEHGYYGVNLDDVAAEANVVRGTVLHYFGSKEGLYNAVLDRKGASLVALFKQMSEDEFIEPAEAIKSFIRISGKMSEQEKGMSSEYAGSEEKRFNFDTLRLKTYYRLTECIKKILEKGTQTGVWDIKNPELRAASLMFAIYGMSRADSTVEEMMDEMYDVAEKLLGVKIR